MKTRPIRLALACTFLVFAGRVNAQRPAPTVPAGAEAPGVQAPGLETNGQHVSEMRVCTDNLVCAALEVEVKGEDGQKVEGPVSVSLLKDDGQVLLTVMATKGVARFGEVPKGVLTAQAVAPGFQSAKKAFEIVDRANVKVKISLQPLTDREMAASSRRIAALTPKAQKDVGKALEALRENRPAQARAHLEAAGREAPTSAEVEYLFGVYASQVNNEALAQSYWLKALKLDPQHLNALLAVSQGLLQQLKADEATVYLRRALDEEPSSWRAHMLMAQADLIQGDRGGAVRQAERAMELGHEEAASVRPVLTRAMYESGEKERAILLLKDYVATHPGDGNAAKLLTRMTQPAETLTLPDTAGMATTAALAVPSNWLPPDVDDKTPPVEPGAVCALDDVVQKAGSQIEQLVHDVDRFTATELLKHESVDKYGIASPAQKRKFDYLVSIQEVRQGHLNVTEYRHSREDQDQFPDGIATNGLPGLVLIFHPYYAPNYEMACEGLARVNDGLAWQVHFRQRPEKPNELQTYQIGLHGSSFSVALKGRAWISADNYQIIRMETDIVAPVPEIKLYAEHTAIEYGPVKFRQGSETLWLPQSVEIYFARRGRQAHRWHTFNNYMLFAVDDKQRIATPTIVEPSPQTGTVDPARPIS